MSKKQEKQSQPEAAQDSSSLGVGKVSVEEMINAKVEEVNRNVKTLKKMMDAKMEEMCAKISALLVPLAQTSENRSRENREPAQAVEELQEHVSEQEEKKKQEEQCSVFEPSSPVPEKEAEDHCDGEDLEHKTPNPGSRKAPRRSMTEYKRWVSWSRTPHAALHDW